MTVYMTRLYDCVYGMTVGRRYKSSTTVILLMGVRCDKLCKVWLRSRIALCKVWVAWHDFTVSRI